MSNRSLVELNHDNCPNFKDKAALLAWAEKMVLYMYGGDPAQLPHGVTFKHCRHHSDPDLMKGYGNPS